MTRVRILLSLLLALTMMLALCACGGKTAAPEPAAENGSALTSSIREAAEKTETADDPSACAGEYTFFCVKFSAAYMSKAFGQEGEAQDIPDQYVDMPDMAGETITLEADGTGYLYWGDDNQGPIDRWAMDGNALQFQAGVAAIDGTIEDGIMTVEIDDGFSAFFVLPGADTSGMAPITIDDYFELLYGAETGEAEPETPPAEQLPVEGEYTLFAILSDGYTVDSDEVDSYSTLTLDADGTGVMTMDDESMDIIAWTAEESGLDIEFADESYVRGTVRNGIIELDVYETGEYILYYAQEGADISGFERMTLEDLLAAYEAEAPDSMLHGLWAGLDTEAGVHMSYDRHLDYMDSDQSFDVHGKDGVYYSARTTYVSGYENTAITFFRDGTAYNLDPDDMTGIIATTTTSSIITDDVMRLDDLYFDISQYAQRSDYTVETREMDGVSYTAEVFDDGAAFYFDDHGQLAYYITEVEGIGGMNYTIHTVDGAVDEALFDISGYEIEE